MNTRTAALIAIAIAVALFAWLFRYELVVVPAGGEGVHGIAYRLDRWTGTVTWIQWDESGTVKAK